LYDAKLDGQPVLAITGHHYHDLIGTHAQQDVDLDKLFMDVAVYNTRIMGLAHVESVTHLACRTALSYRGVTHINFPTDIQDFTSAERSKRDVPGHTTAVRARGAGEPDERDLKYAADILNRGKKVAILAGRGALGAGQELEEAAEILGAPIVKALLGKVVPGFFLKPVSDAAVPDNSPYTTGGIGLLGTRASQEALEQCDTLLLAGTSFPYIEFMPKPGQAKAVQIDVDPTRIGLRYPVDVGLVADTRIALKALRPKLTRHEDRDFLRQAQEATRAWWKLMEERGTRTDHPMKPQVVAWELGKRIAPDAIVSSDSGTITTWFARQIPAKRNQMFWLSGTLAAMANGLPYAIAAQLAYPERQCIAFVGDGGFSMLMAEFATAVKYQLPIKVIVIKNNTLGQIKWEQMVFLGNPEYGCELQPIDFATFARACGGSGFTIGKASECGAVLDTALSTSGPVLIQAEVDANEPPMPAKITIRQAEKFAESLIRGTPHRGEIGLTVLSDKVRELV